MFVSFSKDYYGSMLVTFWKNYFERIKKNSMLQIHDSKMEAHFTPLSFAPSIPSSLHKVVDDGVGWWYLCGAVMLCGWVEVRHGGSKWLGGLWRGSFVCLGFLEVQEEKRKVQEVKALNNMCISNGFCLLHSIQFLFLPNK